MPNRDRTAIDDSNRGRYYNDSIGTLANINDVQKHTIQNYYYSLSAIALMCLCVLMVKSY